MFVYTFCIVLKRSVPGGGAGNQRHLKYSKLLNGAEPPPLQNIFKLCKILGALKATTKGVFNRLIDAVVTYVFSQRGAKLVLQ